MTKIIKESVSVITCEKCHCVQSVETHFSDGSVEFMEQGSVNEFNEFCDCECHDYV